MAKRNVTFMRDYQKVGNTRRLSGRDSDGTGTAKQAGRLVGDELKNVLELSGDIDGVRAALATSFINVLSDRIDENYLNQRIEDVAIEDRRAFFAGMLEKIMI